MYKIMPRAVQVGVVQACQPIVLYTEQRRHIVRHLITVLLVFSVTPLKIKINENQNRSIDKAQSLGKEKKKKYAKTPAKIQVTARYTDKFFCHI